MFALMTTKFSQGWWGGGVILPSAFQMTHQSHHIGRNSQILVLGIFVSVYPSIPMKKNFKLINSFINASSRIQMSSILYVRNREHRSKFR